MQKAQGFVEKGNLVVTVGGVSAAEKAQGSYPQATVNVYAAGTLNLATIYADNALTPKANPFTAATNGYFFFYAANGRYDITFSGGGLPAPLTFGDFLLADPFASGGAVTSFNGRTGAVVPATNDYSLAQINGWPSTSTGLQHIRSKLVTPSQIEFETVREYYSEDYVFAAQSPGGSLSVGLNTITLTPVPYGVNGTNTNHYLYISGGVGAAEAVLISGGTAVSGAASGTVIVTCANTHSGAWTIQSATAGIQEVLWEIPADGGKIRMPPGNITIYARITIGDAVDGGGGLWLASNRNGIELYGEGQGTGIDTGNPIAGTSLRWLGADGGYVIYVNGPIQYCRFHDFHIEGAPNGIDPADITAGVGLYMIHMYLCDVRRITVAGTVNWGFIFTSRSLTDVFSAGAGDTNLDTLLVERTKPDSGGILLGPEEYQTVPKPYMDVARVNVHNCVFGAGSNGIGCQIRFVDSSSFTQCIATGSVGLEIVEVVGAANNYPDAITFRDCYWGGVTRTVIPATWHSTAAGSVNGGLCFTPWPNEMGAPPDSTGVLGFTSSNEQLLFSLYTRNVSIANGDNNNLDIKNSSSVRLSGAAGAAAITGMKHGRPGRLVTLLYNIGGALTIKNQSGSSDLGNRIATPDGADWVSTSGIGAVALEWNGTDNCWFLLHAKTNRVGPLNYIASETGANNAIAGALTGVTLAAGLRVTVQLAHTLQAGANTFDLNGGGAVVIKSSRNVANNIGTAYAATGTVTLHYDGTQWVDVSQ